MKTHLPARDLEKHELRTLVDELAGQPERWRDEVAFSDARRHFVSLYRDDHVDIWLLCWTPSNDTGWHDHDISSGAVAVARGAVHENQPRIGGQHVNVLVEAGQSFCFGPDHIHRMTGAAAESVSIHAYSPPLWRLGTYIITEDGIMRRTSVSYADELRPVDMSAA